MHINRLLFYFFLLILLSFCSLLFLNKMFPSVMIYPATCELCGQWMPGHSKDCPRSGVHPSQWSLHNTDETTLSTETFMQEEFELLDSDNTNGQQRHDFKTMI
ncbi:unnamed protein product [Mucor hiemalis]